MGGFQLRKWSSNNKKILNQIPVEHRGQKTQSLDIEECKRSLEILWNPSEDIFCCKVKKPITDSQTKQKVLSDIAKIFDPVG